MIAVEYLAQLSGTIQWLLYCWNYSMAPILSALFNGSYIFGTVQWLLYYVQGSSDQTRQMKQKWF